MISDIVNFEKGSLHHAPRIENKFPMQAPLAIIGFFLGLVAWWQTGHWAWLLGAVVLVANWPYTLLGIMPTNRILMATGPASAGPDSRALIRKWATLHAGRYSARLRRHGDLSLGVDELN